MTRLRNLFWSGRLFLLGGLLGSAVGISQPASAQTAFCPSAVPAPASIGGTVPSVAQTAGKCTNPGIAGAYSGAALASQAVGDLAGSAANLETSTAVQAIGLRRGQAAPCATGETLVDGVCRANRPTVVTAAPISPPPAVSPHRVRTPVRPTAAKIPRNRPVAQPTVVAAPSSSPPLPTMKAPSPAPVLVDESFRIGSWAEGFGNYEHRTGSQNSLFNCCTVNQPNGPFTPVTLDVTSASSTAGFVGGIDATKRGITGPQDGIIFGVLGGYTWTHISVKTSIVSGAAITANGSSLTTADANGPSLGLYATYFNGPFSNQFLIKNDFLSLNETNSQTLGFGACQCFGLGPVPFTATSSGSGSTSLNQLTISDDITYKIQLSDRFWIAPTAGLRNVGSFYSSSAAALGLANGDIFRLQGGASLGTDSFIGETRVSPSLTGLLFDDVVVTGNNVQGGNFGTNGNILSDQGRLQAEGIAAVSVDFGHGLSAVLQGDLYGGQGIFGAGGKASLRMQW